MKLQLNVFLTYTDVSIYHSVKGGVSVAQKPLEVIIR